MLITHGTLITFGETNRIIKDGALYIEGDLLADIGSTADLDEGLEQLHSGG